MGCLACGRQQATSEQRLWEAVRSGGALLLLSGGVCLVVDVGDDEEEAYPWEESVRWSWLELKSAATRTVGTTCPKTIATRQVTALLNYAFASEYCCYRSSRNTEDIIAYIRPRTSHDTMK